MLPVTSLAQNSTIGFKETNVENQNKLEEAFDALLFHKNLMNGCNSYLLDFII
jgi:hypothetical protein